MLVIILEVPTLLPPKLPTGLLPSRCQWTSFICVYAYSINKIWSTFPAFVSSHWLKLAKVRLLVASQNFQVIHKNTPSLVPRVEALNRSCQETWKSVVELMSVENYRKLDSKQYFQIFNCLRKLIRNFVLGRKMCRCYPTVLLYLDLLDLPS